MTPAEYKKLAKKPHKYKAVRTKLDGYSFDSKAEARRYSELKLLERAKQIYGLGVHPRFAIVINGVKCCDVIPDFCYFDGKNRVVEDVKSPATLTAISKLKAKLLKATYPAIDYRIIMT